MQPYFLPYIGYFQLINAVDKFIAYDDVNFIKKGWINRNYILVGQTKGLFTVSLKSVSQNNLINGIELSDDKKWRDKLLKTIEINYKKAPQFYSCFTLIESILLNSELTISNYNLNALKSVCNYLNISTEIEFSSKLFNNQKLKGEDRIIDCCMIEGATHYINPIGGVELYSKERFTKNKIEISFLKSETISYPQYDNDFVSDLSILDVLMFNKRERVIDFLNNYKLL